MQSLKDFCDSELYEKLNCQLLTTHELVAKLVQVEKDVSLSVLNLNIHSLNSKVQEFRSLICQFDTPFDVIIITEVWTTNITFYVNILSDYDFVTELPGHSNVGGVGVFIHKSLSHTDLPAYRLLTTEICRVESLWCEVCKGSEKFIIGAVYRHPNQSINVFMSVVESVLSRLPCKMPIILGGDFNVDLLKFKNDKVTADFIKLMVSYNFLPTILNATRVNENTTTLIDHIYYRPSAVQGYRDYQFFSGVVAEDISDHLPNYLVITKKKDTYINYRNRGVTRLYTKNYKEKFASSLMKVCWDNIFGTSPSNDVNEYYKLFIQKIESIFDDCFPVTKISRKAARSKLWMTPEVNKIVNNKNNLYKKWLQTKTLQDQVRYKISRNNCNTVIKKAKEDYYNKLFDEKTNTVKAIWKNLNSMLGRQNNCRKSLISKVVINEQEVHNAKDICNEFNQYFSNVGNVLNSMLPPTSTSFTSFCNVSVLNSIFIEPVSESEIIDIIDSFDTSKVCNDTCINGKLLKECKLSFVYPLKYIYNLSLETGIVPTDFKIAKVIPIHKSGDIREVSNYRPISLLSIFNKILEKLVHSRVYTFLCKNSLLYDFQFGFRKHHSTNLALIETMDYCYEKIGNKNKVMGIFLDLSKAFDTVDHNILLSKLHAYGIRGSMFEWFKDYLSNRKQFVRINGVNSDMLDITCGVPQGSVLGPLLFLVYVNDMHKAIDLNDDKVLKLFADDTNLFLYASSMPLLQEKANRCLNCLSKWFVANKLTVNINKTCYILFDIGTRTEKVDMKIEICNKEVKRVSSCKYLGIFIDERLKWNVHVDYLVKKLIKYVGIFYKLRCLLPEHCMRKLYFAFVHSTILYGIEVYANCYRVHIASLITLNNRILRILQNKSYDSKTNDLYKYYNTLPIVKLHEYRVILFVYRCRLLMSVLPCVFKNYFLENKQVHEYCTKYNEHLHIIYSHNNVGQRAIKIKGSKLWNDLPSNLKKPSYKYATVIKDYFCLLT